MSCISVYRYLPWTEPHCLWGTAPPEWWFYDRIVLIHPKRLWIVVGLIIFLPDQDPNRSKLVLRSLNWVTSTQNTECVALGKGSLKRQCHVIPPPPHFPSQALRGRLRHTCQSLVLACSGWWLRWAPRCWLKESLDLPWTFPQVKSRPDNQGCGSALIFCGSGSSCSSQCGFGCFFMRTGSSFKNV